MSDRFDLMTGRKYTTRDGQEKTAWTRIGTMFRSKSGEGFNLQLDVMPLPDKDSGSIRIQAFIPKERTDGPQGQRGGYSGQRQGAVAQQHGFGEVDEEGIPF